MNVGIYRCPRCGRDHKSNELCSCGYNPAVPFFDGIKKMKQESEYPTLPQRHDGYATLSQAAAAPDPRIAEAKAIIMDLIRATEFRGFDETRYKVVDRATKFISEN